TVRELPVEFGTFKRLRVLRIRNFTEIEVLEFFATSFAHGFLQSGIAIVGEKLKWIFLVIFLPHEQQRRVRREQEQRRAETAHATRNQRRKTFSFCAIPNLIMVLNADH